MKIKNINPFEQHVEKIVLIAAILFISWMGYKNLLKDPNAVSLPGGMGGRVSPGQVGSTINTAVGNLRNKVNISRKAPPGLNGNIPDYVSRYTQLQIRPLEPALTQMVAVHFGPSNLPIKLVHRISGGGTLVFTTPSVPALLKVKAVQGRGVAIMNATLTQDVKWVELKGIFPADVWRNSMAGGDQLKPGQSGLPQEYQRTTFYRVEVRRQKRELNGGWSAWKPVKGTYLQPLPQVNLSQATASEVAGQLGILDQSQSQILTPAFYAMEQIQQRITVPGNPSAQPRVPSGVPGGFPPPGAGFNNGGVGGAAGAINRMLRAQQAAAMQQQQFPPPVYPGNNNPINNPNGFPPNFGQPGMPGVPGGIVPPSTGSNSATIPVDFYDQTATPGMEYKYEMRVVMYNPVFEFPYQLSDPAAKTKPWIVSPWTQVAKPVKVRAAEYFFLVSSQLSRSGKASFRIFKWTQGLWTVVDERVAPGEKIGKVEQVPLVNAQTGNLENKAVNFSTGYTLVNAEENTSAGSLMIVVEDPSGNLGVRDSAWDAQDPQQRRLNSRVMQTGVAPSTGTPHAR